MPFYTFRCNSCGRSFEIRCSIAEKESGAVVCPGCGANELDRIFEGFSVAVKGNSPCACNAKCPAAESGGCHGCCGHQHH